MAIAEIAACEPLTWRERMRETLFKVAAVAIFAVQIFAVWRMLVLLIVFTSVVSAAEISGPVMRVRDGDTFVMRSGVTIRLCGIDAPEDGAPGSREAMAALTRLIADKAVRCIQVGSGTPCDGRSLPTNRDRIVAQCFVGEVDISRELVRGGNACDWPKFSNGHYRVSAATCIKH